MGTKEFNPSKQQLRFFNNNPRVWKLDSKITKSDVTQFLPELLFADKVLKKTYPQIHKNCVTSVPAKYRLAETNANQFAINNKECALHRDFCFGLDVIMYGGNWHGGALEIPQLNMRINVQAGDVVIMDSILFHQVERVVGTRFSIVFFTKNHKEQSGAGNMLAVPPELSWLSKPNFAISK